jgi:hypothetical protein
VATGKSTLLTPHEGEQLYFANDISPDGKRRSADLRMPPMATKT